MNTLEGKVGLITGAKGGLGRFVTERFWRPGRRWWECRGRFSRRLPGLGFTALPAELPPGEAARKFAGDIVTRFGRDRCPGACDGGFAGGKSVAETDDATLDEMLDLNYRSAFFIARAVLPHMRRQGGV